MAYFLSLLTFAAVFGLFSLGLNLQWGVAGLVNFGHVAFMTIGAYSVALLTQEGLGIPWALALLIAMAIAAVLGLIIGLTTLRLQEDYLAIVTIGMAEIVRLITNNEEWLTQGTRGVFGYALPFFDRVPPSSYPLFLAGMLLVVVVIVFWRIEWLVRSPWGRVLKAIREDEVVAMALGKNVFLYKLQVFVLGGIVASLAGAFLAWQLKAVYPSTFSSLITFQAWTIVAIGGAGNNLGVFAGALLYQVYTTLPRFLPEVIKQSLGGGRIEAIQIIFVGLTLIAIMVWRPQGLLGNKNELSLTR